MAEYEVKPFRHRERCGAMFKCVKRKPEGKKRLPSMEGSCTIDGTQYRITGWKRKSKRSGNDYLSLGFEVVKPKTEEGANELPGEPVPHIDSDVPSSDDPADLIGQDGAV